MSLRQSSLAPCDISPRRVLSRTILLKTYLASGVFRAVAGLEMLEIPETSALPATSCSRRATSALEASNFMSRRVKVRTSSASQSATKVAKRLMPIWIETGQLSAPSLRQRDLAGTPVVRVDDDGYETSLLEHAHLPRDRGLMERDRRRQFRWAGVGHGGNDLQEGQRAGQRVALLAALKPGVHLEQGCHQPFDIFSIWSFVGCHVHILYYLHASCKYF